ncbi:hypothetical protein [Mucilaginibacter sp.]|uniref:hypothetical protein n=1 Tax=Mucilaginibacter sp. TaxID=1882438 RepID=UPI002ED63D5C
MLSIEILENLRSTKSDNRRKAAKEIGEKNLEEFGEPLFEALNLEMRKNTWETKVEMIISLGKMRHLPSSGLIDSIVLNNNPHDMITYAAAQTYVRLKRQSINDAVPVINLLKNGGLSTVDGALLVLGVDRMLPPASQISELITLGWDLHLHRDRVGYERNFVDPRYGLILACSGWDKKLTLPFLDHCLKTNPNEQRLNQTIENAKKGKYFETR